MLAQEVADPSATAVWVAIIAAVGTFVTAIVTGVLTVLSKRSNTREHGEVVEAVTNAVDDLKADMRGLKADFHEMKDDIRDVKADVRELQNRDPLSRTRSDDPEVSP